jgi:sugar (pentulose or hexulose) kinase
MEFGAKGAALLAAVALQWYATPFEAALVTQRIARSYSPTPDAAATWEARFHAWITLRDAQLPVWPTL